jgi:ribosomal protein L35
MKTNKSYTKRLKVTRRGKIIARNPGQNHFNAKESRRKQYGKRRTANFVNDNAFTNKVKSRFLAQSSI